VCFRVNSCWSLCVHRRCFHRRFCPPPPRRSFHHFPPPCCAPLPRFGKFASVRLRQVLLCAKGKVSRKKGKVPIYSKQKKARCQYIKQKKKKKERKSRTIQGNRITFGGQVFSPVGRHPPFPVLGFGAIFFLISDCLVLERRIPAVVIHPDLGAGLPLWTGTHQGASPLGRHHLCCLCTFPLVSSNIATCLALLFNLALLFDCANPCN